MKTIIIKWSTDDVLAQATNEDIKLTEKQADEILARIDRMYDASVGVNWDVISDHIHLYYQTR